MLLANLHSIPSPEVRMRSENRIGLTDREQRYIQNRLAGQNKTKAALNAGFTEAMAKKAGSKIEKAHVREALQAFIQRYCPPRKLSQVLADALEATIPMPSS